MVLSLYSLYQWYWRENKICTQREALDSGTCFCWPISGEDFDLDPWRHVPSPFCSRSKTGCHFTSSRRWNKCYNCNYNTQCAGISWWVHSSWYEVRFNPSLELLTVQFPSNSMNIFRRIFTLSSFKKKISKVIEFKNNYLCFLVLHNPNILMVTCRIHGEMFYWTVNPPHFHEYKIKGRGMNPVPTGHFRQSWFLLTSADVTWPIRT